MDLHIREIGGDHHRPNNRFGPQQQPLQGWAERPSEGEHIAGVNRWAHESVLTKWTGTEEHAESEQTSSGSVMDQMVAIEHHSVRQML